MAEVDKLSKQVECTKAELHNQQGNLSRHQGQLLASAPTDTSKTDVCKVTSSLWKVNWPVPRAHAESFTTSFRSEGRRAQLRTDIGHWQAYL